MRTLKIIYVTLLLLVGILCLIHAIANPV